MWPDADLVAGTAAIRSVRCWSRAIGRLGLRPGSPGDRPQAGRPRPSDQVEQAAVLQPGGRDRDARPASPPRCRVIVATPRSGRGGAQGATAVERRPAGRGGVLDDQYRPDDVRALDRRCMPCALAALRTTKAFTVGRPGRGVHHAVGDRVGAERQSTHRGVVPVGGELAQQSPDQRARPRRAGRRDAGRRTSRPLAGGQHDPPVDDGELADQRRQPRPVAVRAHVRSRSNVAVSRRTSARGSTPDQPDDRLVLPARHGHRPSPGQVGQAFVDDLRRASSHSGPRRPADVDPGAFVEFRPDVARAQHHGLHARPVQRRGDALGERDHPRLVGAVGRPPARRGTRRRWPR